MVTNKRMLERGRLDCLRKESSRPTFLRHLNVEISSSPTFPHRFAHIFHFPLLVHKPEAPPLNTRLWRARLSAMRWPTGRMRDRLPIPDGDSPTTSGAHGVSCSVRSPTEEFIAEIWNKDLPAPDCDPEPIPDFRLS
jgi:hypothetical protein